MNSDVVFTVCASGFHIPNFRQNHFKYFLKESEIEAFYVVFEILKRLMRFEAFYVS